MSLVNNFICAILILCYNSVSANSLSNETVSDVRETLLNFTEGNNLWSTIVRDCKNPTFLCVRNSIYKYLKDTLNYQSDNLQFTNFLKFSKNSFDYDKYNKSSEEPLNLDEDETSFDDETPLEEMSRSLSENAMKFFMTHDAEVQLPEVFFLGTTVKISPRAFNNNGALLKLELLPKAIKNTVGEGRLFFKKIRKFISQRLIYALLAILLIIKLLAVKILFVLPTIVGVATAKKLILKVVLFLFPALHHLFKLCAYVPYGAKHHIHKHQISHIHEIGHGHHSHGSHHKPHGHVEVISPHEEYPPHYYTDKEYIDPHDGPHNSYPGEVYYGNDEISHRDELDQEENNIDPLGQGQTKRRTKLSTVRRPLTPTEIEHLILKAENEALIKARLQKEKQRIREENLRLQEQLNNALKFQENLKHQAAVLHSKIPQTLIPPKQSHKLYHPNVDPRLKDITPLRSQTIQDQVVGQQFLQKTSQERKEEIPVHQKTSQPHYDSNKGQYIGSNTQIAITDPEKHFQQDVYKAASVTYDLFYSPILEKIDKILQQLNFYEEPCKERLICSMYKNPSKYSPLSNLLSVELSRDHSELVKPTTTNAAVIRFYKYVQAARDGQDKRDCLRLYPACSVNTEA